MNPQTQEVIQNPEPVNEQFIPVSAETVPSTETSHLNQPISQTPPTSDATLATDIAALSGSAPTIDTALSLSKPTAISMHPDKVTEDKSLEILNGSDN